MPVFCPGQPLLFADCLHVSAQVARVGGAPGTPPAEAVTGQPVLLRYCTAALCIARGMTVVAARYLEQITAAIMHRIFAVGTQWAGEQCADQGDPDHSCGSIFHTESLSMATRHHAAPDLKVRVMPTVPARQGSGWIVWRIIGRSQNSSHTSDAAMARPCKQGSGTQETPQRCDFPRFIGTSTAYRMRESAQSWRPECRCEALVCFRLAHDSWICILLI